MLSKRIFPDDLPTEALFVEMVLAASVVIVTGARFTRLADVLAERLQLGSGWIGLILLATVTSLPELMTGGAAVWLGNVDLALGGILGSCSFNIMIIFLLNAMWGGGSVLRGVGPGHALSSSFGLALIGVALLGIVVIDKFAEHRTFAQSLEFFWAALIFVAYLGCVRLAYRFDRKGAGKPEAVPPVQAGNAGLYARIVVVAVVLILASWWLAALGDVLSTHEIEWIGRALGATFVGALFLAVATSLPEIVTSIAAVRLGNIELALGNIFGSNMFNIFVVPALKVVSVARGDGLMLVGNGVNVEQNTIAGLTAMLLTAVAVAGLAYQSQRRIFRRFGFDSILILVTYLTGMFLLLFTPV